MGGNDTLQGGADADRLTGGSGNDRFVFAEAPVAGKADTIVDFVHGADKIALDDVAFGALHTLGPLTHGEFGTYVVYTGGGLYYDADGAGPGAAQLIATLQGAPTLTASDITVI